jgi:MFS family permease
MLTDCQKISNLLLVAFHAMMGPFTAGAIIPSFSAIALSLGIAMQTATYLTTLQIAVLAGGPLFWRPLIDRFGRRPIFLLSLICSGVGNIGCAVSPQYGSMAACRVIVAFFISPPASLGSVVVAECFFKHERARYMGIWTLLVTIGGFLAPLLFGFVTQRIGFRWVYWILAIVSFLH